LGRKKGHQHTTDARKRSAPGSFTVSVRTKYLAAYAGGLSSADAAKKAGTTLSTISYHKRHDPTFAEQWQEAHEQFLEVAEQLAWNLALAADHRSCTMLIFMLKAWKPERYAERFNAKLSASDDFTANFMAAMQGVANGKPAATH